MNDDKRALARRTIIGSVVTAIGLVSLLWASDFGDPAWRCDTDPVMVKQGDTLNSIVRERCSGDLVGALYGAYNSYGAVIYPSQVIWLPSRKGCSVFILAGNAHENC
jgi:hypothetical protein